MGSPLGPTFANIFMSHLENQFLENCPPDFKPTYYRRYVDDTCVLFRDESHAPLFLNYINSIHNSIKFTMETESNGKLPFLDVLVTRDTSAFNTSVYRKPTFSGLGTNYLSYCPKIYKLNACRTLIYRAYRLCSTWTAFHSEIKFLATFFTNNCFPSDLFHYYVRIFLEKVFRPPCPTLDVPKLKYRMAFPYLGPASLSFKEELSSLLSKFFPFLQIELVFSNPLKISSFFRFKDSLPIGMHSNVSYLYSCPKCTLGKYVGCTTRTLKTRVDCHSGLSYRTGNKLSKPEYSSIREHASKCKTKIDIENFKILFSSKTESDLLISESLLIKLLNPRLNKDTKSVPLYIS